MATERKASPLEMGGTLKGDKARGKDAAKQASILQLTKDFEDPRWINGTWDFSQFKTDAGETDWDAVIDAEILRRKWLEIRPEGSSFDNEITFRLRCARACVCRVEGCRRHAPASGRLWALVVCARALCLNLMHGLTRFV